MNSKELRKEIDSTVFSLEEITKLRPYLEEEADTMVISTEYLLDEAADALWLKARRKSLEDAYDWLDKYFFENQNTFKDFVYDALMIISVFPHWVKDEQTMRDEIMGTDDWKKFSEKYSFITLVELTEEEICTLSNIED
jgi:hypothetical protein